MSTVVHVSNISSQTSDKEVRDFFGFCGKITNISVTPSSDAAESPKSATVTFEKETAAKTALLLDNTQLGPSQVQVSSGANISELAASAGQGSTGANEEEEISQDDKPRSRIFAEYLAHGYVLSDAAIQRAIALDQQHGISTRFTQALNQFDAKYKATDRARGIDQSYGITDKASTGFNTFHSYFEKALETPTGQRLAAFYTQGEKQVRDVHAEARRLADLKTGKTSSSAAEASGLEKNQNTVTPVAGTEKTTCQCGGESGVCPCQDGKCACSGCSKTSAAGHAAS